MQPNPYTPGAGDRPRALVGREEQLALAEAVGNQLEAAYAANCLIFVGLRGVGKTALLKEIADRFGKRGWFATYIQMRKSAGVDRAFAEAAPLAAKNLRTGTKVRRAFGRLTKRGGGIQVLGTGAQVGPGNQHQAAGLQAFSSVLEDLAGAARGDGVGVALVVDELQTLTQASLGELIHVVQDLRDRLPLAFFAGGLPYLPGLVSRAATSTERFRFEPTDFLVDIDARRAVIDPAKMEGVGWGEDALAEVVELAGGYPFFLQLYASEAWSEAARSGRFTSITKADVDAAVPVVDRLLEHGMYAARYDQMTAKQRDYLYAMLDLLESSRDDRVRSSDVAEGLGFTLSDASPVRDTLIRKGMIHSPSYGELELSIPGFAEYLSKRRAAGE